MTDADAAVETVEAELRSALTSAASPWPRNYHRADAVSNAVSALPRAARLLMDGFVYVPGR